MSERNPVSGRVLHGCFGVNQLGTGGTVRAVRMRRLRRQRRRTSFGSRHTYSGDGKIVRAAASIPLTALGLIRILLRRALFVEGLQPCLDALPPAYK